MWLSEINVRGEGRSAVIRTRNGFGVMDALILVVVGGGLALAALYSDVIVTRAGDPVEELTPPSIGWRDHFYGVANPAPGVLWIAGGGGKVLRSDDGGASWQIKSTGITENLQDVTAWDRDRVVAVGNDGVVIVTTDGGENWDRVEVPRSDIANKLIRVRSLDGGMAWAVGVMGMILHSDDWGVSWERRGEEIDVAWNDIAFAEDQAIWVVGEFGSMMRSSDDGLTWEQREPVSEQSLMGVAFRDADTAVAVGLDGLVLVTNDAGSTWEKVDPGTPLHLFDVVWDGGKWVAVGAMGVVVTGSEDGRSWHAQRLKEGDLSWHTALTPVEDGVFVVGASQGLWHDGQWTPAGRG